MSLSGVATALSHAVGELNASLAGVASEGEREPMARCEVCGSDCETPLEIRVQQRVAIFDSFECAIHALAPTCGRCGCRVVGHGVHAKEKTFCCPHCANGAEGASGGREGA